VRALLLAGCGGAAKPNLRAAARSADGELYAQPYELGIGDHTTRRVSYATTPPVNGAHHPVWAQDGNYAGVEPPKVEQLVHAMEHGRVIVWYRKGLPAGQVAALERFVAAEDHHMLLVEDPTGMPCDVAITAWAHGMRCERFRGDATLAALAAFRDTYRDQGPETIP
jgi:hypothetical protein